MLSNSYTEDEFKKILRSLFAEKKKVKELQKQLEQKKTQKKFVETIRSFHRVDAEDGYPELEDAYYEKEKENQTLKQQLDKVKPVLKKLITDLRLANEEMESLKESFSQQIKEVQNSLKEELSESKEKLKQNLLKVQFLEAEKIKLVETLDSYQNEERVFPSIEERVKELELHLESQNEYISSIEKEKEWMKDALQRLRNELAVKEEEKENSLERASERFESERNRFMEKLAESLSNSQRKTEIITDLKEEISQIKRELFSKEEQCQIHDDQISEHQIKLKELSEKLESEKSACISKLEEEISILKIDLEKHKELYEERNEEIQKAHQHLAKKVKESTMLRDLVERQKMQIIELQTYSGQQKAEIEQMQNNLNLQRIHEEKLQTLAEERTSVAETSAKEWQEKYFSLQTDWQESQRQIAELQKMKKEYELLSSTFSNLKNILGSSLDTMLKDQNQIDEKTP